MRDDNDPLAQFWVGDHLDRRAEATYLGEYLRKRYDAKQTEPGFVLAVNAEWGVGKTFMLTKWCEQLRFQEHPVVYFDAWSNDFTPEPLIAFIAELNDGLKEQFNGMPAAKRKLGEWIEQGKKAVMPTLKAAGSIAIKQATGFSIEAVLAKFDDDNEATSTQSHKIDPTKVAEQLSKVVGAALKEHVTTRKAISACRKKMEALIDHLAKTQGIQLPIYVVVDELDRCRPDYAIQLLEGIKHLFGVRGVYFVIGTNISQLAHSVAVVYGERFDCESYLKRFFDLEYSLPKPDGELFAKELLDGLIWRPVGADIVTGMFPEFGLKEDGADYLPFFFARYAEWFELSLRDQHGAVRILDAALQGLKEQRVHIHFLLFLVMLFQRSPKIYGQVAMHRHLGPPTEYLTVKPKSPSAGFISVKQQDNENYFTRTERFPVEAIAASYFDFVRKGQGPANVNVFQFPANLIGDLSPQAHKKLIDISTYIDIVRWAGRFSNKA